MTDLGQWFYRWSDFVLISPDLRSWGFVYHLYVGFNALEACAWFAFCLFVAIRFAARSKSRMPSASASEASAPGLTPKMKRSEGANDEIWVDELRVSDIYKDPGMAAEMNATLQLADLMTLSGGYHTQDAYFHNVNTRINSNLSSTDGWRANLARTSAL